MEVMVVLLIIGILVGIAVPLFTAAIESARAKTCAANLRALDAAVEQWKAETELDPALHWGGACFDADLVTRGTLVDDLSPMVTNWDSAIVCPSSKDATHHVTITILPNGKSTASFLCQGGVGGIPHRSSAP